jgi:hypothetical protein
VAAEYDPARHGMQAEMPAGEGRHHAQLYATFALFYASIRHSLVLSLLYNFILFATPLGTFQ